MHLPSLEFGKAIPARRSEDYEQDRRQRILDLVGPRIIAFAKLDLQYETHRMRLKRIVGRIDTMLRSARKTPSALEDPVFADCVVREAVSRE